VNGKIENEEFRLKKAGRGKDVSRIDPFDFSAPAIAVW
jgi:hypothetical protein